MSAQRRRMVAGILVAAGWLASCGNPAGRTSAPAAPAATTSPARSTTTAPDRPCPAGLAAQLATTGPAQQLITVEGVTYDSTYATIRWWQKSGRCWAPVSDPVIGRVGINGFSDHHEEGDYTTPTGLYPISPAVYGNAPDPGVRGAYHRLVCGDWWDEDPSSPAYNTFQHVRCGQPPPFAGASEALWTETAVYPSFAVV